MERPQDTSGADRPLAGIGGFATRLGIGTLIAIIAAAVTIWLIGRSTATLSEPGRRDPRVAPAAGVDAPAPRRTALTAERSPAGAEGPVAREIERRHAAGELSEAQRRFEPCPGGDVRRLAWIDRQQHVVKLVRHRASGDLVEEWFDDAGRLREAAIQVGGSERPWRRRVVLDERGRETVVDATEGLAPEVPPPALVATDPTGAFFSGAGCDQR